MLREILGHMVRIWICFCSCVALVVHFNFYFCVLLFFFCYFSRQCRIFYSCFVSFPWGAEIVKAIFYGAEFTFLL